MSILASFGYVWDIIIFLLGTLIALIGGCVFYSADTWLSIESQNLKESALGEEKRSMKWFGFFLVLFGVFLVASTLLLT